MARWIKTSCAKQVSRPSRQNQFSGYSYAEDDNKYADLGEEEIPFGVPATQGGRRPRNRRQAGDTAPRAGADRYAWNKRKSRPGSKNPPVIDAEPEWVQASKEADFKQGERVFHDKFGYGTVKKADGAKFTVKFDKAGEKKVVENFLRELP